VRQISAVFDLKLHVT